MLHISELKRSSLRSEWDFLQTIQIGNSSTCLPTYGDCSSIYSSLSLELRESAAVGKFKSALKLTCSN